VRQTSDEDMKIIWWFVTQVEGEISQQEGTQIASEIYRAVFLDAAAAIGKLTFSGHQKIATKAVELVKATYLGAESDSG
jgi:hypothetical protein